jgi:tRNA A-37 threonylcarbamoyl transferase component Bud32
MTSESVEIKIEDPQKQQLLSSLSGTFDGVEIKTLATKFCSRYGVEVKNRTWHLKKYKMCFVGSEAVDWLVKEMPSWSREKAVHFGNILLEKRIFRHVCDEHDFKDEYLFYIFTWDYDALHEKKKKKDLSATSTKNTTPKMESSSEGLKKSRGGNIFKRFAFPKTKEETEVRIKCCFGDDIRLIPLKKATDFSQFQEVINAEFGRSLCIKFRDAQGDLITIKKRNDFEFFLQHSTEQTRKLFLFEEQPPISASSSGSGSGSGLSLQVVEQSNRMRQSSASSQSSESKRTPSDISSTYPWQIKHSELVFHEVLGKGFFGEVRRAQWRGIDVAVKVIYRSSFKSKNEMDIFLREIEILSKLRHPKVILFLGASLDTDEKCIVCEFMRFGSLYDKLNHPQFREKYLKNYTLLKIATDIAQGMSYLHGIPILHRDLSSRNILLDEKLNAKVADFGLSKIKEENTNVSTTIGAVAWMAPEVIKGQPYTEKADVYSYGVVLWEMYTAEDPTPHNVSLLQLADMISNKGYRPPIPSDCPSSWKSLIEVRLFCPMSLSSSLRLTLP